MILIPNKYYTITENDVMAIIKFSGRFSNYHQRMFNRGLDPIYDYCLSNMNKHWRIYDNRYTIHGKSTYPWLFTIANNNEDQNFINLHKREIRESTPFEAFILEESIRINRAPFTDEMNVYKRDFHLTTLLNDSKKTESFSLNS